MTVYQKLIHTLGLVQNSTANFDRDIMTIAGMMDEAEIASHIKKEFGRLDPIRQAQIVTMTAEIVAR